jgi:tetracycline resistance efflux pump
LAFSNIQAALFKGGLATVVITTIYFLIRKTIKITDVPRFVFDGIKMMLSSIIILILILTFSGILRYDLQIGQFIAKHCLGSISVGLLPFIFFVIAATIAMLIGTAWGSFGILIPIGVPMLIELSNVATPVDPTQLPMLYPLLGAIISGAIAGTHLSPISDLMFMSSTSSGCYHIDMVRAQASLAIPTIISTAPAFLLVGLMIQQGYWLALAMGASLFFGVLLNFVVLSFLNHFSKYFSYDK